jgi:hypothetical protein
MTSKIAELMSADPVVKSLMLEVFGKSDAGTIDTVMRSSNRVVVSKTASAPPARLRLSVAAPEPAAAAVSKGDDAGDLEDITVTTEFSKTDDERRTVFGWASITEVNGEPVVDRQGDIMDIEELSKSAYEYVVSSRKGGHQHKRSETGEPLQVSDMIESVVFTPEKIEKMGLPPSTPIGWWVGYKVRDDEIWKAVKDGEITGFSVHGKGRRVKV